MKVPLCWPPDFARGYVLLTVGRRTGVENRIASEIIVLLDSDIGAELGASLLQTNVPWSCGMGVDVGVIRTTASAPPPIRPLPDLTLFKYIESRPVATEICGVQLKDAFHETGTKKAPGIQPASRYSEETIPPDPVELLKENETHPHALMFRSRTSTTSAVAEGPVHPLRSTKDWDIANLDSRYEDRPPNLQN